MTSKNLRKAIWLVLAASLAVSGGAFAKGPGSGGGGSGGGGGETAGNNLSFPVIFSDGVLPGTYVTVLKDFAPIVDDPMLPTVCAQESNTTVPVPTNILCYYGRERVVSEETGVPEFTGDPKLWWLQERVQNKWQAHDPIHPLGAEPVVVTALDWGDLLESGAITTRMIRTEMTLFKNVAGDAVYGDEVAFGDSAPCDATAEPDACFAAFKMSGAVPGTDQSINEIQGNDFGPGEGEGAYPGSQTVLDPILVKGYHATVYSGCARLIVQKITAAPAVLAWSSDSGRWVGDAAAPILELSSYAGTYTPEVNAGGNLIYGYNWNAKTVATGKYRLTFVLDGYTQGVPAGLCPNPLNTLFDETTTVINTGEVSQGVVLSRDDLMFLGGTGAEGGATYVDIVMSAKGGGKPR